MGGKLKYLVFVFLVLHQLADAALPSNNVRLQSYLFQQVIITGSTNVNHFQLTYNDDSYNVLPSSDHKEASYLSLLIPAKKIKAENQMMLDDFLAMIKAEKYPTIKIAFSDNVSPENLQKEEMNHHINVTMSGKTIAYTCISTIEQCGVDEWCLYGKLGVRLTDFGIEPPKKFLGMVKVENEVFISFKILFSTNNKEAKN